MLNSRTKYHISKAIEHILAEVSDNELSEGEIDFILHIDGKKSWSWANIRNQSSRHQAVPLAICKNLTVES